MHWMKSHFHMKRLALRKRLKVNRKWVIHEGLDEIRRLSWNTTALQLNWGSMRHSPYNSKLSRDKKKRTQALSRLYSIRCLSSKENVQPVYFFTFQITRPIPVCEVYNATKKLKYFKIFVEVKLTDPARTRWGNTFDRVIYLF